MLPKVKYSNLTRVDFKVRFVAFQDEIRNIFFAVMNKCVGLSLILVERMKWMGHAARIRRSECYIQS
jgi:hypothetical protein